MNFTLERLLIASQITLLIGKITGWLMLPWVVVLLLLWVPLVIVVILIILREIKQHRIKIKG